MSFSRYDYEEIQDESEQANQVQNAQDKDDEASLIKTAKVIYSSYGLNENKRNSLTNNHHQQQQNYLNQLLLTAMNDRRSKFQQNVSFITILIVYTLERFSFYGLVCNYVLYLNKKPLYWESFNASILLFIFLGVLNITSVLGGWIADSFIGKYWTICLSFIIYIIGYAAFPILSFKESSVPSFCSGNGSVSDWSLINQTFNSNGFTNINKADRPLIDEACSWVVILTVVLMGIAVGFIRANLGPFGADQVISRGQTMVFKYFNWIYWCINLGSLLSFSVLAYIQQNFNFFIGYLIPLISLILSFLVFLIASFAYIKREAEISVLSNIFRVFYEAFKSVRRQKNFIEQKKRERALLSEDEEENENDKFDTQSGGYNNYDSNLSSLNKNLTWLDNAKIRYGGKFDENQVDDVKSLKKILILFAILVPYWTVYFQIETTYIIQGLHMKLFSRSKVTGTSSFMIPTAWLSIADQVTVLIMIPLMDSLIYPFIRRKFKSFISENTRLVLGMCLSALSVIVAGLLESFRLDIILSDPFKNTVVQVIDNTSYIAADLNILWQIPQYMLIGLGEVFCSVTCLYYAYSAAPKSMQSIIMGLFYFFSGAGSLFGSFFLWLFKSIIFSSDSNVDDINCPKCRFYYYFYFLAILQLFGVIVFILVDFRCSLVKCKYEVNDNTGSVLADPFLKDENKNNDNPAYNGHTQYFDDNNNHKNKNGNAIVT